MRSLALPRTGKIRKNRRKFCIFLDFFGPWRKWHGMAPNRAGRFFFQLIQALPTFWAEWILDFFGPWRKWHGMAPNGAGRFFFQLIQALPTFWAEWIWILRIFIFPIFWDPKFLDFQVPRFPKSGLGRAWAGLGPWAGWAPSGGPGLGLGQLEGD